MNRTFSRHFLKFVNGVYCFWSVMKGLVEFDSDHSLAMVELKSLLKFQHDVELPQKCIRCNCKQVTGYFLSANTMNGDCLKNIALQTV